MLPFVGGTQNLELLRLRQMVQGQGISQAELARRCGVSLYTYKNLESGRQRGCHGSLLVRLSEVLGVTPGYLLRVIENPLVLHPPRRRGKASTPADPQRAA